MKEKQIKILVFGLIIIFSRSFIFAQERNSTRNIKISAILKNSSSKKQIRLIKKGEIFADPNCTSCQSLAIYNVFENENIKQTKEDLWLVTLKPQQSLKILLEARCLNKGLKLPNINNIKPIGKIYSDYNNLDDQSNLWNKINQNSTIIYYGAKQYIKEDNFNNNYANILKDCVIKLFSKYQINISEVFIDNIDGKDSLSKIRELSAKTNLGILIKLINVEITLINRGELKLKADIAVNNEDKIFFISK